MAAPEPRLLIAGWKDVSLVDIRGRTSFTLWLCGCNLKCPFCHNWMIAEALPERCSWSNTETILEALRGAARLVDYLHITGGEPLVQWAALKRLLQDVRREVNIRISLNTNCTLTRYLQEVLRLSLIDHVATDLKVPFNEMTGLAGHACKRAEKSFFESLRLLGSHEVVVELRIPVPSGIPGYADMLRRALKMAVEALGEAKWYIVMNPLLGPPYTTPRDPEWCSRHCNPTRTEFLEAENVAREIAGEKGISVYVIERGGV